MKFDYQDFQKRLSEVGNSTEELLRLNTELMLNVAQKIAGVEDPRKSEKALEELQIALKEDPIYNSGWTFVAPISAGVLVEMFKEAELQGDIVHYLVFNAADYVGVRRFGREVFDVENMYVHLKKGITGSIWGAIVVVTQTLPPGDVRLVSGEGDARKVFQFRLTTT